MRNLNVLKKREIAVINDFFFSRRAKLDQLYLQEEVLEQRLERLLEKRQIELDNAPDTQARDRIKDAYQPKIDALDSAIRIRESDSTALNQERKAQIALIDQRFAEEMAQIDEPLDKLEARLAFVRAEEFAAIVLLNAVAIGEVRAKYRPRIDSLRQQLEVKEAQIGKLVAERDVRVAEVDAEYRPKLAKLMAPEERLEYKLVRLEERRWAEIVPLINPAKFQEIEAQYDPRIEALMKDFGANLRRLGPISQRAQADINRVQNDFRRQIANLETRIRQLSIPARK